MLYKLRRRAEEEKGFTLIELLVVILIIGILAAIAIPSFLNQKNKGVDASAKELARTAQTAAETYATDNNGSYNGITPLKLQGVEATLQIAAGSNNAYLLAANTPGTGTAPNTADQSYIVTAKATDGNTFSISRNDKGVVDRTCTGTGGCNGGVW
jgi:type IV pilus assembly protein PilA